MRDLSILYAEPVETTWSCDKSIQLYVAQIVNLQNQEQTNSRSKP